MNQSLKKKQSGVVLIVSLVMLVLLTLLGVSTMKTTVLEEKMSGNFKDKNTAFQSAEAGLRDSEVDILTSGRVSGLTGMKADCESGLCYQGIEGMEYIEQDPALVANATLYGSITGHREISNVAEQPKYLIVGKKVFPPGSSDWKYVYSIVSIATGMNPATRSIIEEVYAP